MEIETEACGGGLALLFAEETGLVWCVGEEEEGDHADDDRDRSFDEEDPRPAVVAVELDFRQASGEETAKGTR